MTLPYVGDDFYEIKPIRRHYHAWRIPFDGWQPRRRRSLLLHVGFMVRLAARSIDPTAPCGRRAGIRRAFGRRS